MQLTHPAETITVDFYPVKFADGTVRENKMIKIISFNGGTQSKSLINKKDFQDEVNSRIHGYGYKVTGFNCIPQLQGGLGMAC